MNKANNYIIFAINHSIISKQFLIDKDMKKYNASCANLIKEASMSKDEKLLSFCKTQLINFAPIINSIKGEE